ncbi:MAG: PorP/SprF family type IX secretion system membrane protein [Chitinophagaceae bacterium]|nr:PorP/SprF family type IX secretion system membrane protein [Chitinophagaceae bacterium]
MGAFLALTHTSEAQDVHFSQYFTSPMTLNPGLTGLTQSDFRLAGNYRTQWGAVNNAPYTTATVSYDMASMRGQFANGDYLGFGVLGLFDRAGSGALQNVTLGLSGAYHKAFGVDKQHTLSFGLQASLVQKSIQQDKLTFEDMYNISTQSFSLTTNDNLNNKDLTYPDFALGVIYSGRVSEHATVFGGASMYHLTRPVETFLGGKHKLYRRTAAYAGTQFDMNERSVLYASALFQSQGPNTSIMAGGAVGFVLNPGYDKEYSKASIFYLGGWYRYGDAVIPYVGFEWAKAQLGVSYDANLSGFSPATNGNGALEFSLIFNGAINRADPTQRFVTACPKF